MNKLQTNYKKAAETYSEYFAQFDDWNEEEDERLYQILMAAETALIEWVFNRILKIAFMDEVQQFAPVVSIYNNRNNSPKDKFNWAKISDKVIAAAMRLQ
jgi:hypothetical protein